MRSTPEGRIVVDAAIVQNPNGMRFMPGAGKTEWFQDHVCGPEMVVVPSGSFLMGSPEGESGRTNKAEVEQHHLLAAEEPRHAVEILQPFAVGRHAITRGQFAAFIAATGYETDGGADVLKDSKWKHDLKASWCNPGFTQNDSHPVVCVSWTDAKAYASWLTQTTRKRYRLLSEAEWEYVTRAVAGTTLAHAPFWWGDTITTDQANYNGNYVFGPQGKRGSYRKATVPVGSFAANPWGLFNVHGNVSEWCEDVWHKTYDGAPADGSPWVLGGEASYRVVRGGSWAVGPHGLRAANRYWITVVTRDDDQGFRVVRTV
jgi:formylglycine-generating enzyme required for sulfatase activity